MLILRSPWDSQPQEAAILRRELNPIGGIQPGGFGTSDTGGISLIAGSDVTLSTTPQGQAIQFGSTATTGLARTVSVGYPLTFVFVGTTGSGLSVLSSIATASDKYVRVYVSGGITAQHSATSGQFASTTAVASAGQVFSVVAVFASQSDLRVYAKGPQGTASASNGSSVGALTTLTKLSFGIYDGSVKQYPQNGKTNFAQWLKYSPTNAEISEWLSEPWMLFEPRLIYIPLSITSGGAYTLNLETGVYSFSGSSATLTKDSKLTLESGTYALSGSNASLLKGLILEASSGSYSLSGSDASLFYTHLLNASNGSYAITGSDATLTYTPTAGAYTLNAQSGAYVLLGQDVTFVYSGSEVTLKAGSWIRYRIIT